QKAVLSVSTALADAPGLGDVALSLPSVVGRGGVELVMPPVLAGAERAALEQSAALLSETLAGLRIGSR
ncbi:MAG: L-lactate dehydrogenase, partial [Chloroflexia bacterium]|nr:L-lactate dehydrogenase [Chloroflexia bacterium]